MRTIHEIVIPINLTGEFEKLIYAPSNVEDSLEEIKIVPGLSVNKHSVNYATIEILDKGAGGTEDNLIATINNKDDAGGVAFVANVKQEFVLSTPLVCADAVTLKKTKNGNGSDFGDSLIILRIREV